MSKKIEYALCNSEEEAKERALQDTTLETYEAAFFTYTDVASRGAKVSMYKTTIDGDTVTAELLHASQ